MATDKEIQNVMANLNRELTNIKVRSARGLILSAALVRRETETTPPLTPVDWGNLRASWFITASRIKNVGTPQIMNEANKVVKEGNFRGPNKAKMAADHSSTVAEAQATVDGIARNRIAAMMGYTANYALYVHEGPRGDLGARFQRPGAGVKWLEAAIKRNSKRIVDIVRDNAQIK
jgi:hypothetical protein